MFIDLFIFLEFCSLKMSGAIIKERISEIKQLCQDDSSINNPKMKFSYNNMNHYDEVYPGIFIGDEYDSTTDIELY
jgi:hypothetical protein